MLNITLIKFAFEKSCRDYNEVHKLGSNDTRNVCRYDKFKLLLGMYVGMIMQIKLDFVKLLLFD